MTAAVTEVYAAPAKPAPNHRAAVYLAALVGDGACALDPEITISINQEPLKWLADHYDGRIIFLSTCSVYGAQDSVLDEDSPTRPLSAYAATKLVAEQYLAHKNALTFRLGTLFGVGDVFSRIRLDLVVNTLTVRAFRTGKISVFGGDQFRPLLHVRDVASAIVDNMTTQHAGIFNLHRQNVRIIDLAYQVRNHFPDLVIEHSDMTFQDTRNYRVSSERAQGRLGFKARRSIDEGVDDKGASGVKKTQGHRQPALHYTNQVFLSIFNTHVPRSQ